MKEEYFIGLGNFKQFVQQYEKIISRGYEEYPPLFVKKEVEEERMEETDIQEKIPITVRLNEWGKNGANVRGEPSLDGEIIGGVNGESEIVYQEEWKEDGKRCWIRTYFSGIVSNLKIALQQGRLFSCFAEQHRFFGKQERLIPL